MPPLSPDSTRHPKLGSDLPAGIRLSCGPSIHYSHDVARNPAYLIKAKSGAVASENVLCSEIGVDVMKNGGNAVDAAVAATFCTGVVNMFSSGIGGGGFMVVRVPTSKDGKSSEVWTVDFRETAPALANKTMYIRDPTQAMLGGLSVAIPGEVRGLEEAHKRWGSLPWERLVQPSVELAAGWRVGRELTRRINNPLVRTLMTGTQDWSDIFAPDGHILQEGDIIRRANLSRTLSIIAREGARGFYQGPVADAIVDKVRETGGILTHEDLKDYSVIIEPALQGSYLSRKVYTSHAPTSGPVLLHMLNIMEHYDLFEEGMTGLNVHRLIEAIKFGFSARTRVADPAFLDDLDDLDYIKKLPTKQYAAKVVANITDDATHTPDYYNPVFDVPSDHGTSHTSIVDKNGMAVSITSSVNWVFGSQVLDPVSGILLNNEMDDFSIPGTPNGFGLYPSPYNYPEPGKRPLSSTAPTIVENPDGSFYLAIGGAGGSRIFPSVFQVILNLDWGMNVGESVEFGRLHDQLYPTIVDVDSTYPGPLVDALRQRGHNVTVLDVNRIAAVVEAVVKDDGVIWAASDSRKNGVAAGY
ncbi:gamma-glutamyltranspeptidase [Thelephora ganbajun]|uniref:Gamma-glutamyltranspeptidase n=1 Tax=Thelephora ganbajun TaxID=370292 RepID=A0ACB6ZD54_THEGA|nr:gamma-glutamyltranspeptidase [Thelephora ganbajun]